MKRISFFILLVTLFFFYFNKTAHAQRYAECDACGYCQNQPTPPSNWGNCRDCLYPTLADAEPTPFTNETLLVDETLNAAITPATGRYYTQIGCINTNISDFTKPEAAGSVLNTVLTKLIFPTVGVIAFLYLLYGGFLLATSQEDPEKINQGKKTITGALIGLVFTFMSVFIVTFLGADVLRIPGFVKGSAIRISAAGTVDGPAPAPIMAIVINGSTATTIPITIGSGASDYRSYAYVHTAKFRPDTDDVIVVFTNDDCTDPNKGCPGEEPYRDNNIWLNSLEIEGKRCSKMEVDAPGAPDTLTNPPAFTLWWGGNYKCVEWADI